MAGKVLKLKTNPNHFLQHYWGDRHIVLAIDEDDNIVFVRGNIEIEDVLYLKELLNLFIQNEFLED